MSEMRDQVEIAVRSQWDPINVMMVSHMNDSGMTVTSWAGLCRTLGPHS